jgi:hypothetical protein
MRFSNYRAKYWTVFAILAQDMLDELYQQNTLEIAYADLQTRLRRLYRLANR